MHNNENFITMTQKNSNMIPFSPLKSNKIWHNNVPKRVCKPIAYMESIIGSPKQSTRKNNTQESFVAFFFH